MAYPTLAGPASNPPGAPRRPPSGQSWVEITMKPDHVMLGDFLPPAVLPTTRTFEPEPNRVHARAAPSAWPERDRNRQPCAAKPRNWRPPRLPEPIYATLRRMAVEIVCIGFVGVVLLAVGYKLVHAALH
ncbi:MAG: hypothetical protein HYR63_02860 [Proteobacteria bacterium]|nr:hypothetical protein [Pseudomonadota bacterium]MBI3496273.1 hypothetical protein [Pseudomonadota bacterium]